MYPRTKANLTLLVKFPVFFLYLLFLCVQVFFNLDINPHVSPARNSYVAASSTKTGNAHHAFIEKKTEKKSLRLNKRYEPSGSPDLAATEIIVPLIHVSVPVNGQYQNKYMSAAAFCKHALRGPPAVA
jgi:hypothetical protein